MDDDEVRETCGPEGGASELELVQHHADVTPATLPHAEQIARLDPVDPLLGRDGIRLTNPHHSKQFLLSKFLF